jgi:DNA-binding response OmpR family regulator
MSAPATILVVDDDIQNLRLLQVLLRPEGYVVRTANSGKEALASIADDPPDLILLDDMMPEMRGVVVARALKDNLATRSIPIIMVTAQTDREARLAALDAGAEDFLTKPVDRVELWLRVRNLLRLKELSDLLENRKSTLEARTVELQAANEAIRGFTAAAAHDLRSPLVSIAGFSALLTQSWETFREEDRRKFVASIDRQSKNMSRLVDDLFTSASIEGSGLKTSPELVVLGGSDRSGRSAPPGAHPGQLHAERIQVRRTARARRGNSGGRHGRGSGSRSWTGRAAGVRVQTLRQVRPRRHPGHKSQEGHRPRSVDRAWTGGGQRW